MRSTLVLSALAAACLMSACDAGLFDMECGGSERVDLTLHFVEFDDYAAQDLFLRVTSSSTAQPPTPDPFEEVFRANVVIPTGDFLFHQAESVIPCDHHHVDFFVDVNNNGAYDAPPIDHAWRLHVITWDADDEIEVVFGFTIDPNSCSYRVNGVTLTCTYGDIEWPASAGMRWIP